MKAGSHAAARTRLAIQFATFGLVTLVAATFALYLMIRQQEERLVYRLAEQRADELVAQSGGQRHARGFIVRDAAEVAQLPDSLRAMAVGHHLIDSGDEIEHVVVRDVSGVRHIAVYGDGPHRDRMMRVGRIALAVVVILGAAVLVFAAWWSKVLLTHRPGILRRLIRPAGEAVERSGDTPFKGNAAAASDHRSGLAVQYTQYQRESIGSVQREREFIANIGHELRTPITLVLTGCELLMETAKLAERDKEQLRRIVNAAEHMSESVRSFMILARDGDFGSTETVELRGLVLDALAPHRAELRQRGIALNLNVGIEAAVQANREAAFVVVGNLIRNAIKYTDRGSITVHYLGNTLYVSDTGCGISESDLVNIFVPFYRARSAAESGRAGLGLGLTIVKRICDFYGWSIRIRSGVGVGTTISVELSRPGSLFG